jgi:recombination protein RecT
MTAPVDTRELSQELEQAAQPKERKSVFDLIERMRPELEKALPAQLGAERFARIVTTEIRRTPKLLECSPESLLGAIMLSAQLGLEPGPLGHVYLVPFKRQVEFIIGYRGMIDLAYRSGLVKDVAAELVREGDEFTYREGTRPVLDHVPAGAPGERPVIASYAVARLRTGGAPFVVTYQEDWDRAKAKSAAGSKGLGPWATDEDAMRRKTSVRRLQPLLPQSPVWAQAVERDEQPAPDVGDVIEGEAVES